ncbi:MAG: hypothetical protein AB4372_20505, partial [Xenococcus sp. (in: cyanobacteria)]
MDNNLTKNGFFSRSIKLDLTLNQISLKQYIIKLLQSGTIAEFTTPKENCTIPKLNQICGSLSEKIILLDDSDLSSLVYSCAIAFSLANLRGLPPLQMAQELVSGFASKKVNLLEDLTLQFTVRVIKNGLMEFSLSDRSVGYWLGLVIRRLQEQGEQ